MPTCAETVSGVGLNKFVHDVESVKGIYWVHFHLTVVVDLSDARVIP
jgi:hypothetical protein